MIYQSLALLFFKKLLSFKKKWEEFVLLETTEMIYTLIKLHKVHYHLIMSD